MTERAEPTLADVLEARRRIAPYLQPTPLYGYPELDEVLGTRALVKHENHQPTGRSRCEAESTSSSQLATTSGSAA